MSRTKIGFAILACVAAVGAYATYGVYSVFKKSIEPLAFTSLDQFFNPDQGPCAVPAGISQLISMLKRTDPSIAQLVVLRDEVCRISGLNAGLKANPNEFCNQDESKSQCYARVMGMVAEKKALSTTGISLALMGAVIRSNDSKASQAENMATLLEMALKTLELYKRYRPLPDRPDYVAFKNSDRAGLRQTLATLAESEELSHTKFVYTSLEKLEKILQKAEKEAADAQREPATVPENFARSVSALRQRYQALAHEFDYPNTNAEKAIAAVRARHKAASVIKTE